jgi:hypothetical protein
MSVLALSSREAGTEITARKRSAVWLVPMVCELSAAESGDGVIVTVSWFKVMGEALRALRGARGVKGRRRKTTKG